jgi:VWFA-related protein
MLITLTVSLLLTATPAPVRQETRTLRLSVTDAEGRVIHDLQAQELAILENGVARPVLRLSPDARPLTLALVVDTGTAMAGELRLNLVPALTSFLRRLPEGTRIALWTSGARPTRLVGWTTDSQSVAQALARVVPEGGNVLIDTIDEAVGALRSAEGRRTALVIVSGNGVEFSSRDEALALQTRERPANIEVDSILIDTTPSSTSSSQNPDNELPGERELRYEKTLGGLSAQTGGVYARLLSAMSVATALGTVGASLADAYLLVYSASPGTRESKTRVQISRPNARVRFAPEVQ